MNKKIVHSVFENIAGKFPENIAIEQSSRTISYQDLNMQANQIAHILHENGIGKDSITGIFLPASIEYITSMLGILKAGGVFMPLDIEFPKKRLKYILNKTSPALIITSKDLKDNLANQLTDLNMPEIINRILAIEDWKVESKFQVSSFKFQVSDPDDSSYIIYTSGSTGEPKAILGCHKGLSHFIHWEINEFGLDENTKVSLFAPTTFDVSFRDIFVPLLSGGTVCIPDDATAMNIKHLVKWMENSELTLVHCVPSLFRLILKEIETLDNGHKALPRLKHILLAGEPLYGNDVIKWMDFFGDRIELVNIYGPSETTLAKIYNRIKEKPAEKNKIMPLGKPISNTAILILKDDRLCRIGELGEIYIKTPFRSKGYYGDPEMTAGAFIQNPLNNDEDIIYKTGDLGRYLPDRSIEFIGRLDRQVKIHGNRIELNEIESALLSHSSIEQTLVAAQKTSGHEIRLICYYIGKEQVTADVLREHLKNYLPDYMLPSFFVQMDVFPLNINGKIDKKALPSPEELIYENIKYEPPADETEDKLAGIWGEILNLNKVGVNNSFFQIGGNSLIAVRIISKIYKTFGTEISIKDFFDNPSIRKLSQVIARSGKQAYTPIESVNKDEVLSDEDMAILHSLMNETREGA